MRTIIAGSRDGIGREQFDRAMKLVDFKITTVICGMARGVDTFGLEWAESRGIPVERFPADWDTHGKKAGYLRNAAMAEAAEALVLIWTGKSLGSKHMRGIARERGLLVRSFVPREACA